MVLQNSLPNNDLGNSVRQYGARQFNSFTSSEMTMPFPGMEPYLEHPALWPSVHTRMMVALANQLGPKIMPRYVASIEDRVFIESPAQERVPDIWVQMAEAESRLPAAVAGTTVATALVVELQELEVREHYIEILDRYQDFRVVTVIELVSPSNKKAGPGRASYVAKQKAILRGECHLVEIDLLRRGRHVLSVPTSLLPRAKAFDYLVCVGRHPDRKRFELYPCRLREPLPTIPIPLAEGDSDVPLAIQTALEQVYAEAGYRLRVRYNEPCKPRLSLTDQVWATERWAAYRQAHPELFPKDNGR
jgi:hypothetical protein